jgi:hypothetical protein
MDELQVETNLAIFEFLQTDLALSFTFADLANTELRMEDRKGAESAMQKAEAGYTNIPRF